MNIIQTSFAAGEIAPSIYGRTDIAQYANACEIVQNIIPRSYGTAISMPGTRYVATVSDSTLKTRLIKFVFNRRDAYAIEMGDLYMRFYTNRGQVITPAGTEDLSAYTANLKAHWTCNDNTNSTTVLDAVGSHSGSATTLTTSMSTTGIVSTAFNLKGLYHISVDDHVDYSRTVSTQPMTYAGWFYYSPNFSPQTVFSKSGEYDLSVNSSKQLSFIAYTGTSPTTLLLHMNGTNGSTTFTDSGYKARAVTAFGNAQISTAQSKFGGASGLFDGTGDYLTVVDHADWQLGGGTGDFTIDAWVRFSSVASGSTIISQRQDDSNYWTFNYSTINAGMVFDFQDAAVRTSFIAPWVPVVDTWYHVALVRDNGTYKFFINGTMIYSLASATSIPNFAGVLAIGSYGAGTGTLMQGWIDELRIVNKTAVWSSNFAPPTTAYSLAASNSWQVNTSLSSGWHFFAIVFQGTGALTTDCIIYIDGVPVAFTFTSNISFTRLEDRGAIFRIGTTSSGGANIWANKLDNIALIHQALTAANILGLYTTTAYQITTVYTANEVFDVHYSQLNDVIWLAHPNHPPQKLVRTSANEWAISDAPIVGGPFLDNGTPVLTSTNVSASSVKLDPTSTTGTVNIAVTPTNASLFTVSGATLGHHNSYWMVGGLADTSSTTGLKENGYIRITNVVNSYTATATVIKALKSASPNSIWAEGAWSAVRGYPSRVIIQGNRLWFARTAAEPQKQWGSKIFDYENFALDTEAADDSLNLPLSSNESNEIQWLAAGKSLLAGTFGGVFVTNSGSSEAITPTNATASEEVGLGADNIMPKKVGGYLYYIQRFGKKLREMFFSWDLDTYKAVDKTILAAHILGDGIIDMDVQNNPETILYCVRTNGTLATMTREIDQDMTAWAKHTTSGTYTSVAVIPSQSANYDEVWVIVERWINGSQKKYIEYFENIEVPARQDQCLYLHAALTYDAYQATSISSATISLSASTGSVTLTSSTAYFTGGMINKRLRAIDENGNTIGEGSITATASTTSITLSITTTFNALSYATGYWGVSVATISGIDHLESKTIGILADGLTESLTRTVASGAVTLGSNYFVISAGLSYDQIIFTLRKEIALKTGTVQAQWQRYNQIAFKVNRSTQNFKYGPDSSNLDDIQLAITPTVTTLYTGILPPQGGTIAMRGGYQRGAQVYIKNTQPLPIEILNIIGNLESYEG